MLITLAGVDGAGKSTQTARLVRWLQSENHQVTVLDKWDIFDTERFPECRFILADLDLLRRCIAEMDGAARAMFLFWSISITMKHFSNASERVYISDGYWIKHLASEILYGNDEKWLFDVVSHFPESDLVVYFDIDVSMTAVRKRFYTPYECGREGVSQHAFVKHQTKLKEVLDGWAENMNWYKVDASLPADEVFEQICRAFSQARSQCHA
ncbi:thymidylate kinase [compost metagenome]